MSTASKHLFEELSAGKPEKWQRALRLMQWRIKVSQPAMHEFMKALEMLAASCGRVQSEATHVSVPPLSLISSVTSDKSLHAFAPHLFIHQTVAEHLNIGSM